MRIIKLMSLLLIFELSVLQAQPYMFPELKGYKMISGHPVYTPESLPVFMGSAADSYIFFGFENLHVREYKRGKNLIIAEIYRHKDKTNAFGIFASERSPSFRHLNIGSQGYKAGDGYLSFFKDRYFVKVRTSSDNEKVRNDVESLSLRIADMLPGDPAMPSLLSELPGNGRVKHSETFITAKVLGHDFLKGAFSAQYALEGVSFVIYLFEKDGPAEVIKSVTAYLSGTGLEPDESPEGKYILRDGRNGNIFLSWKENRIVVIQGLARDQSSLADRYTAEILK